MTMHVGLAYAYENTTAPRLNLLLSPLWHSHTAVHGGAARMLRYQLNV